MQFRTAGCILLSETKGGCIDEPERLDGCDWQSSSVAEQPPADPNSKPTAEGISGIKTELASVIEKAGPDISLDEHAKRILSFKVVAAMILKGCADEFKDETLETIINECLSNPPLDLGKTGGLLNGNDRVELLQQENINDNGVRTYFDCIFTAYKPGHIEISIPVKVNFEHQNVSNPGYPLPKRGFVYTSFAIVDELRRREAEKAAKTDGENGVGNTTETENAGKEPMRNPWDAYDYNQVHKAYSIWICTNPKAEDRNTIVRYRTEREVVFKDPKPQDTTVSSKKRKNISAKAPTVEPRENYDLEEVVLVNLGKEGADETQSGSDLINMLNLLFRSGKTVDEKKIILQNDFKIAMGDEFEQDLNPQSFRSA